MAFLKSLRLIDFYSRTPTALVGLTDEGAIAGGSSIRYSQPGSSNETFTVQAARRVPPHRFLSGYGYMRWRCWRELPWAQFSSNPAQLGYYFLASQEDVSGTSGVCYAARFAFQQTEQFLVQLRKYPDGLAGSGTGSGSTLNLTPQRPALGTIWTLAVEWRTDLVLYAGVQVRCWAQEGTTVPSRLSPPLLTHVFPETVQPLSYGEGEFVNHATVGSDANTQYIVDQVGRYQVLTL